MTDRGPTADDAEDIRRENARLETIGMLQSQDIALCPETLADMRSFVAAKITRNELIARSDARLKKWDTRRIYFPTLKIIAASSLLQQIADVTPEATVRAEKIYAYFRSDMKAAGLSLDSREAEIAAHWSCSDALAALGSRVQIYFDLVFGCGFDVFQAYDLTPEIDRGQTNNRLEIVGILHLQKAQAERLKAHYYSAGYAQAYVDALDRAIDLTIQGENIVLSWKPGS